MGHQDSVAAVLSTLGSANPGFGIFRGFKGFLGGCLGGFLGDLLGDFGALEDRGLGVRGV